MTIAVLLRNTLGRGASHARACRSTRGRDLMLLALLCLQAAAPQTAVEAEHAFCRAAQAEGQWTAFRAFATPDAVMFTPQPERRRQALPDQGTRRSRCSGGRPKAMSRATAPLAVNTGPWVRPKASRLFHDRVAIKLSRRCVEMERWMAAMRSRRAAAPAGEAERFVRGMHLRPARPTARLPEAIALEPSAGQAKSGGRGGVPLDGIAALACGRVRADSCASASCGSGTVSTFESVVRNEDCRSQADDRTLRLRLRHLLRGDRSARLRADLRQPDVRCRAMRTAARWRCAR